MPRRLPSLSSLRAFEAAARLGSAKRAADELSVTPAAISHQIRQLEDELDLALFVRRPRRLLVTPRGVELQQALTGAFGTIADAVERVRTPHRRSLTLSATPAVAARWLVPRLPSLRDACADLDLRIHVSHEPMALDGIEADAAIRYGHGRWPGLVSYKLFDNVFAPVCSPHLQLREPGELPRHGIGLVPRCRLRPDHADLLGVADHRTYGRDGFVDGDAAEAPATQSRGTVAVGEEDRVETRGLGRLRHVSNKPQRHDLVRPAPRMQPRVVVVAESDHEHRQGQLTVRPTDHRGAPHPRECPHTPETLDEPQAHKPHTQWTSTSSVIRKRQAVTIRVFTEPCARDS
jgi:DNA-binding transcriptional LysR family regulator